MKNITILFLLVSLIFPEISIGQTRGYLGKRFTVELNLNNGYSRITKINKDYKSKSKNGAVTPRSFNFRPEFSLSYTIGRRVDLGLLFSQDVVDVNLSNIEVIFNIDGTSNLYSPNLEPVTIDNTTNRYNFYPNNPQNIGSSRMYQFFFRFYSKQSIAPVGFYHQIALGFARLGFEERIIGKLENYNAPSIPLELKIQKINVTKLSYFFGNKKVFANGLYINSGVNFNIPLSIKKLLVLTSTDSNQNSSNYNYQYLRHLNREYNFAQLMEFKVGLGFIF